MHKRRNSHADSVKIVTQMQNFSLRHARCECENCHTNAQMQKKQKNTTHQRARWRVAHLKIACDVVGLRACAGDRYQKFRCGAPGARCPGGSHRRPSAVACSPPREGSAWSTPNASQVSLKRMKASQTFDKLRIGRKKRACTTFLAFCQKLYASYLLLHFLKTKKRFRKKC